MLRFDFIPYPLWRRRFPAPLQTALRPIWSAFTTADADARPPASEPEMIDYLVRGRLLTGDDARRALDALRAFPAPELHTPPALSAEPPALALPLRIQAQWEALEAVLMAFPTLYPPLWASHAAMIAALSSAARVDLLVPSPEWARLAAFYLDQHRISADHVRWIVLPTDDIWIRDYAPFFGIDANGQRAAVGAIYDPLPQYPQARDNAVSAAYARLLGVPFVKLDIHTEGGNLWTDGAGTLMMTDDIYARNPTLPADELERRLRRALAFDRLIITPKLRFEETGHIDLMVKLADARTVLAASPAVPFNREVLQRTAAILRAEGFRVFELPTPPPYLNWGAFAIWRSYTNALTVNGRVLVPTFGINLDALALAIYREAMPDYDIIPINCAAAANGGGAVHCLTHEVPR
jgi:agmatine deiminase